MTTTADHLRAAQQRLRGINVLLDERWSVGLATDHAHVVEEIAELRKRLLAEDYRDLHPANRQDQP